MNKHAQREDRESDEGLAATARHDIPGERHFGDIELLINGFVAGVALHRWRTNVELRTVNGYSAGKQRMGPMIVRRHQTQLEGFHVEFLECC